MAISTDQLVVGFTLYLIRMFFPPGEPAFIGTKAFLLCSFGLRKLLSALFAKENFNSICAASVSRQPVSSAVRLHGVDRKPQFLSDRFVAYAFVS
jgi:hypothetical protein